MSDNEQFPGPFHHSDDPFDTEARRAVGYSRLVREAFDMTVSADGLEPLRVARVDAEGCTLLGAGEPRRAKMLAKLRRRSPLAVGDWVAARSRRGELLAWQRLERHGVLRRRAAGGDGEAQDLAVGLDRVLICVGLDRDFRLTRIERWLSLVHESGAAPLVVLTKAGLVSAEERAVRWAEVRALAPDARVPLEVVVVDVLEGLGVEALDEALAHGRPWAESIALVGSSGVGKSTLLNHLVGGERMVTGAVSDAHGKGRHTTTHRELVELRARGLVVIDTPGLREVGVWGDGAGVETTFADIVELARACRFADCQHDGEPGCAVAAAMDRGTLDPRRLESMRRLEAERLATARRASAHERRAHERRFARVVKNAKVAKDRGQ